MIWFVRYLAVRLIVLSIHVTIVTILALFVLTYILPVVLHVHLVNRAEGI